MKTERTAPHMQICSCECRNAEVSSNLLPRMSLSVGARRVVPAPFVTHSRCRGVWAYALMNRHSGEGRKSRQDTGYPGMNHHECRGGALGLPPTCAEEAVWRVSVGARRAVPALVTYPVSVGASNPPDKISLYVGRLASARKPPRHSGESRNPEGRRGPIRPQRRLESSS